jgi:hypothetical protein
VYHLGCTAWICVKFGIAKLLKSQENPGLVKITQKY